MGYGLDFGYTNDPTSITEIYKLDDKRILNQLVYQTGLSNRQIAKFIKTKLPVYCDSAEPKSIAELCLHGINAVGAKKGADSVRHGLALMQDENYLVTKHSVETIAERRKYIWKIDKNTGKSLNIPIDNWNHAIDGIRYHESTVLAPPEQVEVW